MSNLLDAIALCLLGLTLTAILNLDKLLEVCR
jgi:hypothetical protein